MRITSAIRKLRWQPNVLLVGFFVVFLLLFISLGFWQLNRAEEKQQWLLQRQSALHNQFVFIDNLSTYRGKEFTNIELQGKFDPQTVWFLENQSVNGQVGFDLLAPFVTQRGEAILINLGWQAIKNAGSKLNNTGQTIKVRGMVRKPSDLPFVSNIFSAQGNSVIEMMPSQFPYNNLIDNWFLQIDPNHELALLTHWQGQTITPAKHRGYAVQWFAMAMVLTIAFVLANTNISIVWRERKPQQKSKQEAA